MRRGHGCSPIGLWFSTNAKQILLTIKPLHSAVLGDTLSVMAKASTSIRLSDAAHTMLTRMSERSGISKTAIMELAIREKAKTDGIGYVGVKERAPRKAVK